MSTPYEQVTSVGTGEATPYQEPALLSVEEEAKLLAEQAKAAEGFTTAGPEGEPDG